MTKLQSNPFAICTVREESYFLKSMEKNGTQLLFDSQAVQFWKLGCVLRRKSKPMKAFLETQAGCTF